MRKTLILLAVLALCTAGTVVAQSSQDMGNTPTAGATFTTGTVVSVSDTSLVIRKDSGNQAVLQINKATVGVKDFPAGRRVKVDYHVDMNGAAIADTVMAYSGDELTPKTTVTTTTTATPAPLPAPVTTTTTYETPAPAKVSEPAHSTVTTTTATPDNNVNAEKKLPRTASSLPLVGLIGLLALGAALTVRSIR